MELELNPELEPELKLEPEPGLDRTSPVHYNASLMAAIRHLRRGDKGLPLRLATDKASALCETNRLYVLLTFVLVRSGNHIATQSESAHGTHSSDDTAELRDTFMVLTKIRSV